MERVSIMRNFATITRKKITQLTKKVSVNLADIVTQKIRNAIVASWKDRVVRFLLVMITIASITRKAVRNEEHSSNNPVLLPRR